MLFSFLLFPGTARKFISLCLETSVLPLSKSSLIPSFHNVLGSRIWYQTNTKIGVTQTGALTVGAPLPVSAFVAMLVSLKMGSQALFKEHVLLSQLLPCDSVGLTVGVCALPKNIVYFRRVQDKKTTSTSPHSWSLYLGIISKCNGCRNSPQLTTFQHGHSLAPTQGFAKRAQ